MTNHQHSQDIYDKRPFVDLRAKSAPTDQMVMIPHQVITDTKLTGRERHTMIMLYALAGGRSSVTITNGRLRQLLNLSVTLTVNRYTRALAAKGWLTIQSGAQAMPITFLLHVPERLCRPDLSSHVSRQSAGVSQ